MTLLKLRRLLGEHSRPVLSRLYSSTVGVDKKELKTSYDAVVIGAGMIIIYGLIKQLYSQPLTNVRSTWFTKIDISK
jgi:hypothetical protein